MDKLEIRRLTINMSSQAAEALGRLAEDSGETKTDVIRYALGFMRLVLDEHKQGNRIVVIDRKGESLKELVMPGWEAK